MPRKPTEDLTGKKFGRWTVLGPGKSESKYSKHERWECKCECGAIKHVLMNNLIYGRTHGCRCINTTHKHAARGVRSPEYNSWSGMKQRCYYKGHIFYKHYGGRGITVCDRWLGEHGFENFLNDMGNKPTPKHSLERIENNGNYEPGNCKWATVPEQRSNKRNNVRITFMGETLILEEWSRRLKIGSALLGKRIKAWGVERAFTQPVRLCRNKNIPSTGDAANVEA